MSENKSWRAADAVIAFIGASIDLKLANFMSLDCADLDPVQLAKAQRAVESVAQRRKDHPL